MSLLFIVPVVLSIALVSFVAWRISGDAVLLLVRRAGTRRTRMAIGVLAATVMVVAVGAVWFFTSQSKRTALEMAGDGAAMPATAGAATAPGPVAGDLNLLVQKIEDRLKREPDDAQGWALFARTQMELQRYAGAARAYAKAVSMLPKDVDLRVEQANAELMANARKWTPAAIEATEAALALNPQHLEALWLGGTHRFETKDYAGATRMWEKLLKIAPADSDYARSLATTMVEARALRDGKDPAAAIAAAGVSARPMPATPAPASSTATGNVAGDRNSLARELQSALGAMGASPTPVANANSGENVSGTVSVLPAFRDQVTPDATVFVFARAAGEGKSAMPLAAKRFRAADLPVRFELGDNDAMSPQVKLSSARQVVIIARMSKSGEARAQAGDLEGISAAAAMGSRGVSVVIDRRLP